MKTVDDYLQAGTRENTRTSYQAAIRHFEIEWKGFLPATSDSVARYLAEHAEMLSINTLRLRLAALAQWHVAQGFPDPTKAPLVTQVMRGIKHTHPAQVKQAEPLLLKELMRIDTWLRQAIAVARAAHDRPSEMRHLRNHALLLLGFWRGFRWDELTRIEVQNIRVVPGQELACFLPRSKGDRNADGATFKAPALITLCPVTAYQAWIEAAGIMDGPVFRKVDRWGSVSAHGLHVDSLVPLLRTVLKAANIEAPELYSAHSLRRGFANWATSNGWDIKTLMQYVGWTDVASAMRYIDPADPFAQLRPNLSSTQPPLLE